MMQAGSFDAKAMTPSRRNRRRTTTVPRLSRPTMLQLFLPKVDANDPNAHGLLLHSSEGTAPSRVRV